MGLQRGEERRTEKKIFEEIIVRNFTNLMKNVMHRSDKFKESQAQEIWGKKLHQAHQNQITQNQL